MDTGATSVDVAVTNAGLDVLGHVTEPLDARDGLVAVFERVPALVGSCERRDGLVVIGGGLTGLGHNLLAGIHTQVCRQSPPLATGDLPIVLDGHGQVAGVVGAARLVSDHIFSPA